MDFGQNIQRTSILTELPLGNIELGEFVALSLNDMVLQSGITNPKAEEYDFLSTSWRKLAEKPDKTEEDLLKLENTIYESIDMHAQSFLLFIAKQVGNTTGKIDYSQFEEYLLKYRFGHEDVMNRPDYIASAKNKIKIAFTKIVNHGEPSGNNTILDKSNMSVYLYALITRSKTDDNGNFIGFIINGILTPREFALSDNLLFEDEDNLFSGKLRTAYKVLNHII